MHNHTKTGQRKVSPPGPTFMSSDQVANYLKDLRSNRPTRPTGSRPYPGKAAAATSTSIVQEDLPPRAASAFSMHNMPDDDVEDPPRAGSALSHRRTSSHTQQNGPAGGRPLAQEPRSVSVRKNVFPSQVFSRSVPIAASPVPSYRENGQRTQEKEEARSLRDALQGMDLEDDTRIHDAAQDEATQLVWMHQNPGMAQKNPYAPYRNPDSTRRNPVRKSSGSSSKHRHSIGSSGSSSNPSSPEFADSSSSTRRRSSLAGNPKKNLKVNFALPEEPPAPAPKPRTVSGDSSKGVFRNPNDHIYEEPASPNKVPTDTRPEFSRPDSAAASESKPRNAFARTSKPLPWLRDRNSNGSVRDKISRFDIHKNPPTQSRNAGYIRNEPTPPPEPSSKEEIPTKDGIEIRSDDIRAATSKRVSDRSVNLPMPSAVSDRVGRPIVSFDPKWQVGSQPKTNRQSDGGQQTASPVSTPPIPTIEVAPSIEVTPSVEVTAPPPIPVINVPDIKEPSIAEVSPPTRQQSMPSRQAPPSTGRPVPTAPLRRHATEPHDRCYTPYSRSGVPTARCESCSMGISGKIVTAGGCRFHSECFVCYHCQTALECVAFYEEPNASRDERLASSPDEDRLPRFYCHLDFHELFSPRCKSCKTPIEGEVVVACGAEWHVGHFFCAECGDPFNSTTPFVERDGFAWCLNCHSKRTSSRCQGCKQHVLDDVVINAIGGQWHEHCFVCHECGDGFGPDGRFFVREGEPRRTAKGRIIGGPVQLAVCERCEGIRLKAPGMC
ncbi:hypothetical protein N7478_006348 [Penicillium angulare]|uniref:uncharacterized protein n=1 Tax=Penicillium angulare TaxID=116970 RepID=UPI002542295D|nr:uncharacterized protein N7478_006348 [Penicillium angulare]KAJ5280976.1 hypothetical protein N7478_006348 [Penicillium angulare]